MPYDSTTWNDPPPPAQYRGGALAWHLRTNPPSAELARYIDGLSRFSSGDVQDLLHYLHMYPRPELLGPLLSVRAVVPRTTFLIGSYTRALSSTAVAMHASGDAGLESTALTSQACLAALAMHRELVVASGRDAARGSWAAIRSQLREKWLIAVPAFLSLPEAQDDIEAIRAVLESQLEAAWAPHDSYASEDAAVALALDLGDEGTLDTLLRLLDHWDVARTRIGAARPSRKDISALSMIGQALSERGSASQVTAWVLWLIDRNERGSPDAREVRVLSAYAQRLSRKDSVPGGLRARLCASFGLAPVHGGVGR